MVRQQELPIPREKQPDRNASLGGKSFYFFDLDENVFHIESAHYVFHKKTNEKKEIPGKIFWEEMDSIGKKGFLKDYEIRPDDLEGSFQRFRDIPEQPHTQQPFIEDLQNALKLGDWMGPSWNEFHHAVTNQRAMAVITARGHHPETIKAGIALFTQKKILDSLPNYLSVLPVSHPEIQATLGGGTVPELKRKALRYVVEEAFKIYGYNDHHRFGMSDDDPKNVQKIIEEFTVLKKDYPKVSFFVIETTKGQSHKWEVFVDHTKKQALHPGQQLSFF
ncbi:hypothetical protein K2X05_09820 [bacterium]|nr:hypothetical protein [bacterium]